MAIPTKITVLAVILAVVVAIITDEFSHSMELTALVLLVIGFFLPLFVSQRLKRRG
ncbi:MULTISPECIES: hypothetical protein [unclassified Haladaptatus]|uniref:hypothetical protein n=1 Tax=unclassified Haladaptatus TaxID=2622732 RepID=UPI000AC4CC53|nr:MULTISPECIES: hypothetical protein [unclassified Haladaptatus]MCO8246651.1 hypothetical protein [Haladaptatus sp. AB643]MCO8256225.1 hypothetical protein [Haladaptatus sp. AB618]